MPFPQSANIGSDAQSLNFSWDAEHGNFFFRNPWATGTESSDLYVMVAVQWLEKERKHDLSPHRDLQRR